MPNSTSSSWRPSPQTMVYLRRALIVGLFSLYFSTLHLLSSSNADWDKKPRRTARSVMAEDRELKWALDSYHPGVRWRQRQLLKALGPPVPVCIYLEADSCPTAITATTSAAVNDVPGAKEELNSFSYDGYDRRSRHSFSSSSSSSTPSPLVEGAAVRNELSNCNGFAIVDQLPLPGSCKIQVFEKNNKQHLAAAGGDETTTKKKKKKKRDQKQQPPSSSSSFNTININNATFAALSSSASPSPTAPPPTPLLDLALYDTITVLTIAPAFFNPVSYTHKDRSQLLEEFLQLLHTRYVGSRWENPIGAYVDIIVAYTSNPVALAEVASCPLMPLLTIGVSEVNDDDGDDDGGGKEDENKEKKKKENNGIPGGGGKEDVIDSSSILRAPPMMRRFWSDRGPIVVTGVANFHHQRHRRRMRNTTLKSAPTSSNSDHLRNATLFNSNDDSDDDEPIEPVCFDVCPACQTVGLWQGLS